MGIKTLVRTGRNRLCGVAGGDGISGDGGGEVSRVGLQLIEGGVI